MNAKIFQWSYWSYFKMFFFFLCYPYYCQLTTSHTYKKCIISPQTPVLDIWRAILFTGWTILLHKQATVVCVLIVSQAMSYNTDYCVSEALNGCYSVRQCDFWTLMQMRGGTKQCFLSRFTFAPELERNVDTTNF